MERHEIIEWALIILVIVAWWPRVFFGYDAGWYHAVTHYVSPIVLAIILVRRYRRVQEGFEFSRRIVDAQHQATGANVLGQPGDEGSGAGPKRKGVKLPKDLNIDNIEAGDSKAAPDLPNIPGISGRRPEDED